MIHHHSIIYFEYNLTNEWVTFVMYVLKQLRSTLKVNIFRVSHITILKNVYK